MDGVASPWLWVLVASALGAAARSWRLGHPQLWLDELTTALYTRETWDSLAGAMGRVDVHPPFYYGLQKLWLVFGDSPAAMRSLPVLLGTLSIPILFLLGRRLLSDRVAVIACFLLATAPLHVEQSRQLRMYPLLTLCALVALLGLATALRAVQAAPAAALPCKSAPAFSGWMLFTAGSILAFYAHNTALLLPVLASVLVLGLRVAGRAEWSDVRGLMLSNAVIAIAVAPWLSVLAGHVGQTLNAFWLPQPTLGYALGQISGIYPYPRAIKIIVLALCCIGLWELRRNRAGVGFIAAFAAAQPALMWAISYLRPVLIVRAMAWPSTLTLFLPAVALARLSRRWLLVAATTAVVALQVMALPQLYPARREVPDFRELARPLAGFDARRDRLVLGFQMLENVVRYEAPAPFDRSRVIAMTYGDRPEALRAFFRSHHVPRTAVLDAVAAAERVWVVTELEPKFPIAPADAIQPWIDQLVATGQVSGRWESGNLVLLRIERRFDSPAVLQ